jgi:hypothetical protein
LEGWRLGMIPPGGKAGPSKEERGVVLVAVVVVVGQGQQGRGQMGARSHLEEVAASRRVAARRASLAHRHLPLLLPRWEGYPSRTAARRPLGHPPPRKLRQSLRGAGRCLRRPSRK